MCQQGCVAGPVRRVNDDGAMQEEGRGVDSRLCRGGHRADDYLHVRQCL
jgi:hypothetical protein